MTILYRAYDDADRLLYVGISDDVFDRLGQHRRCGAAWTRHTARLTFERHETREAAATAELAAIRGEDPVFNIAGRPYERWMQWAAAYPVAHADDIDLDELNADLERMARNVDRERGAAHV